MGLIKRIKRIVTPNNEIKDTIHLININRVFYASIISIMSSFLLIITASIKNNSMSERDILWFNLVIRAHVVFLVVLLIFLFLSYKLRKRARKNKVIVIINYLIMPIIISVSIAFVVIDQLITASITPIIIASIATGVIFIINPIYSFAIYSIEYIFYFFILITTQINPSILLSNRINGLFAIALGFLLSLFTWKNNFENLEQKEFIKSQQKELENKNKKLEYYANFDMLTGLINRRCFEQKASTEIENSKKNYGKLCFLILDIDDFKGINDKYGHPAGDILLKELSYILKSQLRESDYIGRIGGEEYAILLSDTDLDGGILVSEKIRKRIEGEDFTVEGEKINITVSIGITLIEGKGASFKEGYKNADKALYIAKSKGKNRVESTA